MVKHCYDELRAYHVSLLCCGESAVLIFPEFKSCVVLQAYLKKCMQADDYIQFLNGQRP